MCGFAGFVSFSAQHRLTPGAAGDLARELSRNLAHRGPDGEGTWSLHLDGTPSPNTPQALFVHRRLAVIDPVARSDQPMHSPDGKLTILFNGEIYNYRQLRRELSPGDGGGWKTNGDTEVLLAAYDAWGERCVDRLEGMFAFAILDRRQPGQPRVFLARDPAGEKPLFYRNLIAERHPKPREWGVVFGSEPFPVERLADAVGITLPLGDGRLAHYLAYGYVSSELGRQVHPGAHELWTPHSTRWHPYFTDLSGYNPHEPTDGAPFGDDPVETTRRLVEQAVEERLVSDVPLGCLLSGGIDSSIVACCMKRAVGDVRTFSIGFDDDPRYDESRHAAEVARHLGTDHREFRISIDSIDVEGDLEKLAAVFGEPFADSSAIPTHLLARETRKEVTVALGGDGGDELFGGYDRYRALAMTARLRRVPGASLLARFAPLLPARHPKSKTTRARRLIESLGESDEERYAGYLRIFSPAQLRKLAPDWPAVPPGRLEVDRYEGDLVAAAAALDRATYLPGDLLVKLDRCAMLHGLEVRAPFMDRALLRFAGTLRGRQLVKNGKGKALLRAAFGDELPPAVFSRPKMGFAVPIGQWLRGRLRPMLNDLLFSGDAFSSRFDQTYLRRLVDEHQSGRRDHGQRLYALLMLELWWRQTHPSAYP